MTEKPSILTIFTAPKPFTNPHITTIQRNAIKSWVSLGDEVRVILMGDEAGMAEEAARLGIEHMPDVERSESGTPFIPSMFELARLRTASPFLACLNADVMMLPDMLTTTLQIAKQFDKFLVVGQRWDADVREELEFGADWDAMLLALINERGRPHRAVGSDYFIFPRDCFTNVPKFAIGRSGWDNWMIYHTRRTGWPAIDATGAITVIHQDHDYSHLPNNEPPYRLPETLRNIRLAGGRRTIFLLVDTDHHFKDGNLQPIPVRGGKLVREIETFPIRKLGSTALAEIFFMIFHPLQAFKEWRGRLTYKFNQVLKRK